MWAKPLRTDRSGEFQLAGRVARRLAKEGTVDENVAERDAETHGSWGDKTGDARRLADEYSQAVRTKLRSCEVWSPPPKGAGG
jgi:hypothetical protein